MNPVFHKTINKDSIDYLQKKEKYAEAMQTYVDGSIDSNNEDLRKMKTCLYGILSSFMMYNPVLKRNLSSFRDGLDVTPLISIEKEDPMYGEKMQAALLVLYYCIKNRSFNYAISSNASHDEISQTEALREWMETNAELIIHGDRETEKIFAAVMVLLYDKMLSAVVELYHDGPTVVTGYTVYHSDNYSSVEANTKNTSSFEKVGAMSLKLIESNRSLYKEARAFWHGKLGSTSLSKCRNTFLFGTYDLKEMNRFLSKFDFKLYDISTKYYGSCFCEFEPIGTMKKMFYTLVGNNEKYDKVLEKHKDWSFLEKVKSSFKLVFKLFPLALVFAAIVLILRDKIQDYILPLVVVFLAIFFLIVSPFYNKWLERKKRKVFSLFRR